MSLIIVHLVFLVSIFTITQTVENLFDGDYTRNYNDDGEAHNEEDLTSTNGLSHFF